MMTLGTWRSGLLLFLFLGNHIFICLVVETGSFCRIVGPSSAPPVLGLTGQQACWWLWLGVHRGLLWEIRPWHYRQGLLHVSPKQHMNLGEKSSRETVEKLDENEGKGIDLSMHEIIK